MNKLGTVFVQILDLIFQLAGMNKIRSDKIIQKLGSLVFM